VEKYRRVGNRTSEREWEQDRRSRDEERREGRREGRKPIRSFDELGGRRLFEFKFEARGGYGQTTYSTLDLKGWEER